MTRYRVTGALVNARVAGNILGSHRSGGYTVLAFYLGAFLPPGTHPEDIERLLRRGYIEVAD